MCILLWFVIMHTRSKGGGFASAERDTPLSGNCLQFCPPQEARRYDGVLLGSFA